MSLTTRRARRMTATALGGALTAATLTLAPPAQASPTWLPSTRLSDITSFALGQALVVDDAATSTVVWVQNARLQAATRPYGGSWSAPVTVPDTIDAKGFAQAVVAADGELTAVWEASDDADVTHLIRSATRTPSGVWTAPVTLAAGDGDSETPAVAIDGAGTVTAVWQEQDGPYRTTLATRPAGGPWGAAAPLSSVSVETTDPHVVADTLGQVTVVWRSFDTTDQLQSVSRPAGGAWGSVEPLSDVSGDAFEPDLAVDAAGTVTAVWQAKASGKAVIHAASRPPTGTWTTPVPISDDTEFVERPDVVVDEAGTATAVWRWSAAGESEMQASSRPPAGAWSDPTPVSTLPHVDVPTVLVDDLGAVTVAWQGDNGSKDYLQAVRRVPGGAWGEPAFLTNGDRFPDSPLLAADPAGNVTAVWTTDYEGWDGVDAAGLDVAGPVVSLTAPAAGQTGQALPFAASATDAWSAVPSYTWSFGDGSSGSGAAPTHTYAAPGTYAVTLAVTDAVGNTSTRTSSTTVTAAPVPPPTPLAKPALTTFRLADQKIATDEKTKLKVRLSAPATLKIVLKSKHRHVVNGKRKYIRVVLKKSLPAGVSKVTIKGKALRPDGYVVTGSATNLAGTSTKQKTKLVVVRP